jgi:uncharacterized protein (DUF2062 family)
VRKKIQTLFQFEAVSAKTWSASVTFGFVAGLFPILGPVTVLSLALGWLFRLHIPLVLAVIYLLYPLQLLLMVPFTWLGEWGFSAVSYAAPVNPGWFDQLVHWAGAAVGGWLLVCMPTGIGLFVLAQSFFEKRLRKQEVATPQSMQP